MNQQLTEAIVSQSQEAIEKFLNDIDVEVRAFGVDFDAYNDAVDFCFDTDSNYQEEKEAIEEDLSDDEDYIEGETPIEDIGCWAYQAMDDREYQLEVGTLIERKPDEDSSAFHERKEKALRTSIDKALRATSRTEVFAKLKKTTSFFLAYQEHDDSLISVVEI